MNRSSWSRLSFVAGCLLTLGASLTVRSLSVGADSGDSGTAFVSIVPCRLVDTRPGADNIGARSTPVGPGQAMTVQVTGPSGNCRVPSTASGVALNVTALNGTAASFLSVYPADVTRPLTSNLNWVARQPPTPNKVDVKLSSSGSLAVFNNAGNVDVIVDVVGYYATTTTVDLLVRVQALEQAQYLAVGAGGDGGVPLFGAGAVVQSVTVTAPSNGSVVVNSTLTAQEATAADWVTCSITTGIVLDDGYVQYWQSAGPQAEFAQLAGTRLFAITAGETVTYNLFCRRSGPSNASAILDPAMTAIFVASHQ